MHDFIFYNPTKVIFGRNKEELIGAELANARVKKVLFVYGRNSIKKSGLYDRIIASLNRSAVAYVEHSGVASNPLLAHVQTGAALAKREKADAVLSVGGGSVLDEGKAIAVGAKTDEDLWNYFTGKTVAEALPNFTVLTLAASGSELNGGAVITNAETKQKYIMASPLLYPKVSILNPELTFSVPPDYSAYGAVDALTHVLEAYFTKKSGPVLQDLMVESIVQTVIHTQNTIMREPNHYAARAEFMWAAALASNGSTLRGLNEYCFPNHMIEHSLSALYNIAHGAGLGIVVPAWMKWYSKKSPQPFQRFSEKIFNHRSIDAGIQALEDWFAFLKVPTRLADVGLTPAAIGSLAENATGLATRLNMNKVYTSEVIAEILSLAV
jgi:alcohol dehydrogenase YqhD (iron-dependent ADH family)